jgi:hypothetical protein
MGNSMGIFSAMMYREHLHELVMARAKELNPTMGEAELKVVEVPLPKKVTFTAKAFMQPSRKIVVTAMVATDEKGYAMPSFVWHPLDNPADVGVTTFEELPNHTMHRIIDLLKTADTKPHNPTVAMLDELSSVEKVAAYGNH